MKMNTDLLENIKLQIPEDYLLKNDGSLVLKLQKTTKKIINNILVPKNEKQWSNLKKALILYLRNKKATLGEKYLLTPSNTFILNHYKAARQIMIGGYHVIENVSLMRKRKKSSETINRKRQKMMEQSKRKWEEEVEIQRKKQKADEKVNVAYRIIYVTHFADKSTHHTSTGFLRNVARDIS
jgi:hypothetical protein